MTIPTFFLPRGIRNNNPGNIRRTTHAWQGQSVAQTDPDFVTFDTPLMGLRALMKTLLTYYMRYHLNSVESLINRWAPPHENATDHYIHAVAKALDVKRTDIIDVKKQSVLITLSRAIIAHENGNSKKFGRDAWYDDDLYRAAYRLALNL